MRYVMELWDEIWNASELDAFSLMVCRIFIVLCIIIIFWLIVRTVYFHLVFKKQCTVKVKSEIISAHLASSWRAPVKQYRVKVQFTYDGKEYKAKVYNFVLKSYLDDSPFYIWVNPNNLKECCFRK